MKIKEIRVVEIELNPKPTTTPRTPSRSGTYQLNRPQLRVIRHSTGKRDTFPTRNGKRPACIVTAEDGTWGFGISLYGGPRDPNHLRSLCPLPRRAKIVWQLRNCGI